MGMYTGLRVKCIVKKEYRKDIDKLINTDDLEWKDLDDITFKAFAQINRSSMIPFGSLSYMPDEWEKPTGGKDKWGFDETIDTDGFDRFFNVDTGVLCFQCSLKNYESTIEIFLNIFLSKICQKSYHIEKLYEEDGISTLYKIENGALQELDCGIVYREYDDNNYWYEIKAPIISKDIKFCDFDFTYGGEIR